MGRNMNTQLKNLTDRLKSIKAKDIMTKGVITTTEDTPLADISRLMVDRRISGLPVLGKKKKKRKIVGIITANDLFIVMDMIKSGDIVDKDMATISHPTVKFAMSTEVTTAKPDTTLDEITAIMKYKNVQTLPILKGKKIAGVISRRDVYKKFYSVIKDL